MNKLFSILSACWVFFIGAMWFYSHAVRELNGRSYYIQFAQLWSSGTMGRAVTPLAIVIFFYVFYFLWRRLKHKETIVQFKKMTPAGILLITLVTALLAWNGAVFLRSPQAIYTGNFFSANLHLLINLFLLLLWIAAVLLSAAAAGECLLSIFKIIIEYGLSGFLFAAGSGLLIWSLIIFAAAWLGIYNIWTVLIPACLFIAVSRKKIADMCTDFFTASWEINYKIYDLRVWMFCFWIFLIAINFTDIIRPIPTGWDDLGRYMNKARMIALRGQIVPGGEMFPFELLASAGFQFSANAAPALAVSWLGGLLGSLAVFAIGKRYMGSGTGITAAAVWYTMPMIAHISYADMKVDTMLFFISALSVWSFLEWTKNHKDRSWLYLCALLAGFAWTIKITSALLITGISVLFFWQLAVWKDSLRRKAVTTLFTAVMLILPFIPWAIYNVSVNGWQLLPYLGNYTSSINPDSIRITPKEWEAIGIDFTGCSRSAYNEEVGRYTGHQEGFVKYLSLPWDLTMNTFINALNLIIGFLFLAFLPLWLLTINKKTQIKPESKMLIVFSIVYYAFWSWQGQGIIWYGIVFFLPFSLGAANLVYNIIKPRWLHIMLSAAVVVSIISHLVLRSEWYGNQFICRYSGGQFTASEFIESILPDYNKIVSIIENESAKTFRIGTFIPYFVKNNDRLLFEDNQLDAFNCIDSEQNDEETLDRLRKLGFKYIIFDLNTASIESNPEGSLHRKVNRFVQFANSNLQIIVNNIKTKIAFMKIPE
ncbi:MAG: glycosyltransferase family 39 protein [Spirochaetes bacterium]|nr:glycosyltransferase family 39 protein [Spirochaetota bacterium]